MKFFWFYALHDTTRETITYLRIVVVVSLGVLRLLYVPFLEMRDNIKIYKQTTASTIPGKVNQFVV